MNDAGNVLINRVEAFIKKFYLNALIKGVLMSAMLLSLLVLVVNALEYYAWFPGWARFVLLLVFAGVFLYVMFFYLLRPIVKLFRYRKQMALEEAARLIGLHFPEVEDRLVNTLQLLKSSERSQTNDLLLASIEQRMERMRMVAFTEAVDFGRNMAFLRYAVLPVILLLALVIFLPGFITRPTQRILNFNQDYLKPLPFSVHFDGDHLQTVQNEDFTFEIFLKGDEWPDQFLIDVNGGRFLMQQTQGNHFTHTFKKPVKSVDFTIIGGSYTSNLLTLKVHPKPLLMSFEAEMLFPEYTQIPAKSVREKTRLAVPEGTKITWRFYTRDADSLLWVDEIDTLWLQNEQSTWEFRQEIRKEAFFAVKPMNRFTDQQDQLNFNIEMIPDAFPDIAVEKLGEQFSKSFFFSGLIADDYGFTDLKFTYQIQDAQMGESGKRFEFPIQISERQVRQNFYFTLNTDSLNMVPGDKLTGRFEVRDNDAVNGAKMKTSEAFVISIPTQEQIDSLTDQQDNAVMERVERLKETSSAIQQEIEQLMKDLVNKKELDWNDQQRLNALQEKLEKAQEEWNQLEQDKAKNRQFEQENLATNEQLLEKQQKIDKLFEEVIPDELKAMMEEIQKLMDEMPREKMQQMLQQLKDDQAKMEDLLDRNLQLLEQLKVEKDLSDLISKLEKLGEKLEKNAEELKSDSKNDSSNLKADQEAFEKLSQKLDSVQKKNEQLDRPIPIENTEAVEEEIMEQLEQAGEQMEMNQGDAAKKSKQKAGKKMKEMANSLQMAMAGGMMEQQMEDAHALRILLENVLRSSLGQEALMVKLGGLRKDDPSVPEIFTRQKELSENFGIVEDSLQALARRQPMIEQFIFDELENVRFRVQESLLQLKDAKHSQALSHQQFSLMAMNKLALMLSEALENMQNSMGMPSGMPSQGQPKPGQQKGQQSLQKMREMQEALGKQLEQMRKEGEQGKDGEKSGRQSEEMARMAAQQEAIRQQMQQMLNGIKAEGELVDEALQKIMEEMDKLEEDLVNKRIGDRLFQRQKEIESRLLESEKAEQKREEEKKRESKDFKDENFGNLVDELEYKSVIKLQQERLRLAPLELQPYYKKKVNGYLLKRNAGSFPKN